jgi:CRP/FNR family transcriptional regulator, anaerobic regulatory protein
MNDTQDFLKTYFEVDEQSLEPVAKLFSSLRLTKGSFFLKAGTPSNRLGFLKEGIIREFLDVNGKEITKWIATSGYFVADLASFKFGTPAKSNFQALSNCELYTIEKATYQSIPTLLPGWPLLENKFMAKCFMVLEERVVAHLSLPAEERYQQLFGNNPELFNQVPLQFIASMLGMSAETLSRIRKKTTP